MKAFLKSVGNDITFISKSDSNHWSVFDTPKEIGGSAAATKPMEMVLEALAGCTAVDVMMVLKKMKQPIEKLEIEVEGENADEHPKVFTKIIVKYILYGDLKDESVQRAINLSKDSYCSVSAMLKKTAEMEYNYEIKN